MFHRTDQHRVVLELLLVQPPDQVVRLGILALHSGVAQQVFDRISRHAALDPDHGPVVVRPPMGRIDLQAPSVVHQRLILVLAGQSFALRVPRNPLMGVAPAEIGCRRAGVCLDGTIVRLHRVLMLTPLVILVSCVHVLLRLLGWSQRDAGRTRQKKKDGNNLHRM